MARACYELAVRGGSVIVLQQVSCLTSQHCVSASPQVLLAATVPPLARSTWSAGHTSVMSEQFFAAIAICRQIRASGNTVESRCLCAGMKVHRCR